MRLNTNPRNSFLNVLFLTFVLCLLAAPLTAATPTATQTVEAADSDAYHNADHHHALWLPGISTDFVFVPRGDFVERADGTAQLSGTAVDPADPGLVFEVEVHLAGRTSAAPAGSPKKELMPSAYVENGGPVDASTWHYYTVLEGILTGAGDLEGALLEVSRRGPAFQVGYGANNKNVSFGGSGWLTYVTLSQPFQGAPLPTGGNGDFNVELNVEDCISKAKLDPVYGVAFGSHVLWLPGIGKDFVMPGAPGLFAEYADGYARLTGVARRASNPRQAFEIDVLLTGVTHEAPPGSPKKELRPSAYVENGGPIDPSTWHYYTAIEGTLTGLDAFAGAVVELDLTGPAFQVGYGANGKNLAYGASSWFDWTVVEQPSSGSLQATGQGDFNIDLRACLRYCVDTSDADLDYLLAGVGGHALTLRDVGRFVLLEGGGLFEREDGTARLAGTVRGIDDPSMRLEVEVELGARSETPPAGSPKLELPTIAYAPGGPVDPAGWWYYQTLEGTLFGRGSLEGAEIAVTRHGPSFQVGEGANGKNTLLGASSWLTYTVVSQPTVGAPLPGTGEGDFNVDLVCLEPPVDPMLPLTACVASKVEEYRPGASGSGEIEAARTEAQRALGMPQDDDSLNFVSLGFGGRLTVSFEQVVIDGPGDDLFLFETTFAAKSCGAYPERARVEVSLDGKGWTYLGDACQDASFDLGKVGSIRYVRIEDRSNLGSFFKDTAADGFDVDAILGGFCDMY